MILEVLALRTTKGMRETCLLTMHDSDHCVDNDVAVVHPWRILRSGFRSRFESGSFIGLFGISEMLERLFLHLNESLHTAMEISVKIDLLFVVGTCSNDTFSCSFL